MAEGREFTLEEVAEHNTRESLWLVMKTKVYDVTEYVDTHPGGADKFIDNAGTDITTKFEESHSSKEPAFIAAKYEIGTVKASNVQLTGQKKPLAKAPSRRSIKVKEDGPQVAEGEYTLGNAECDIVKLQFTQLIEVAGTTVEAGILIYDAIYKSLSTVKHLFKTPKKVLAFRVVTQLERLIKHSEDEEYLKSELYNMAMRHLSYVKYEEMKKWMHIFIATIIDVLRTALDEYWSDGSQRAWQSLFAYLGAILLKNISEFGGKVALLRSSWKTVEKLASGGDNKKDKGTQNSAGGGFGDALFFNIGVMSPEIASLISRDRADLARLFDAGFRMMVNCVSEPPTLNEELYVLAARHLDYGTEEHHFPVFGQAVMVTLRSLLPRVWNWDHEDAWGWLWNMASTYMIKSIANGHAHVQCLDNSMTRLETADMDELGTQFYGLLFELSAEVQQYFNKPNSLVKFIVVKVIKTIGTLLHSPDEVTHGVRALGMRHIKYAIPPDLFPVFGSALCTVLPSFLEGFWDENVRDAWATVFEFVKDCMTRAVLSGTTLVTKALVSNNVADCEEALSGAPRNERLLWQLEVDVSNIKVSPFNWALQDAKISVAEYMLNDILMIRADRESYYYGKDMLFQVHPDLIEILCKLAPKLLFVVCDGLMWHSRNIVDGHRRVNYYIRDVYGDPHAQMYQDPYNTPLAQLTRLRNSVVFTHPYVLFLINLKWLRLGRDLFILMQMVNIAILIFFMLGWILLDLESDVAFACRCITLGVVSFSLFVFQIPRIVHEIRSKHVARLYWRLHVPVFLTSMNNVARLVSNIGVVLSFCTDKRFIPDNHTVDQISSSAQGITCCLLFMLLIETSKLSITLLKYRHRLNIVSGQFMIYGLCLLFILMGFATSMQLSDGKDGEKSKSYDNLWHCLVTLYATSLGLSEFNLSDFSAQMLVLYIIFSIFSIFLFTRMLLAIFTTVNIEEDRQVAGFANLERAELSIDLESSRNIKHRQLVWDNMKLDAPLEFDAGDSGPAGGLQVLEAIGRQMSQRAADDRIVRYPGECDPGHPWPRIQSTAETTLDDRLDKIALAGEKIRKTLVDLQKRGMAGGQAGLPTLSEGDSNASSAGM